jgi:alpha-1,6-mannosyltransferase
MLGVFYRSPDFFDYFRITQTWHSFTIRIGIEQLENLFGRNDKLPQIISNLIFYFSAIYCVFRYCNKPSWETLYIAVQAILGMILFGIASHIWPWYILWIIGFVALIPKSKLSIWGLSVILLTPFSLILFRVFPNFDHYFTIGLPSLFIYLIAFLCFFLLPDRWLPDNLLSDFKIK